SVVMVPIRHFVSWESLLFTDAANPESSTLSLHDALPIWAINAYGVKICYRTYDDEALNPLRLQRSGVKDRRDLWEIHYDPYDVTDRKSTRLNSSHLVISYAVLCSKKKTSVQNHVLNLPQC